MKVLLVLPDSSAGSNLRSIVGELADDVDILEARGMTAMTSHIVHHPDLDLLVADLHAARTVDLPSNTGHVAGPSTRLVVWSSSPCRGELMSAAVLGAMAYVPTTAPRSVTLAALRIVMAGGRYFPPDLLVGPQPNDWETHPSVRPALTPRQAEVLRLMAAGRSNKAIAQELGTTDGTIKVHVAAILKALGVRNRTEAVMTAQRARGPRQSYEYSRRDDVQPVTSIKASPAPRRHDFLASTRVHTCVLPKSGRNT